jgi:hypothetical protein
MADLHGTSEAIILVKASPHLGKKHGETVCCAGVDDRGRWLRLYPVTFRTLDQAQQFKRWDRIKFCWHKPKDDQRPESLRVDHQSLEIVGTLKPTERLGFLSRLEVTSIEKVEAQGKTFALLRPRKPEFFIKPKPSADLRRESEAFEDFAAQTDLFNSKQLIPIEPCPYAFKYRYETDDGEREGTCQDWETDATFLDGARSMASNPLWIACGRLSAKITRKKVWRSRWVLIPSTRKSGSSTASSAWTRSSK